MTATLDVADQGARPLVDVRGVGATEEATRGYVRSPVDVLRLVVFGAIAVLLLGLTLGVEDSILGFEEDLVLLFDFLTPSAARVLSGVVLVVHAVIGLGLYAVPLITKRYRLFGYLVLAGSLTFFVMTALQAWVDRATSSEIVNRLADQAGLHAEADSSVVSMSQMAAQFVVVAPFVSRRWRHAGAATVAALVVAWMLLSPKLPVDMFVALPAGAFFGTAVLLAFGRPDRRPTLGAIRAGLANAGLPVADVRAAKVDARGSTPYFATLADGTGLFVKVLGAEERAADLLFRVYRFLRLKDVGDARPFSSLRRTIEHEALVALMARDVGIRTPRLRGVVDVGADSMLLAYELVDGASLDGVPDDEVTDELMRRVWGQVALLRQHRIAHRDLRRANVFVDADGTPWMIDFGFSEVAVSDGILDADVAQMLASFAVVVGADRAVAAAVDVLGAEAVGRALPRLQTRALSGATQTALKQQPGLLNALQQVVIERCGVEQVQFAQLQRVSGKTMVMFGALVLATYFLFPQLADLPGIAQQVADANWWWAPLMMLSAALTYVAAGMSISGAVPERLPVGPVIGAQVASSFASKLAPAGLGGMALNVRFLQKQGVDQAVAVSSIGLNTVAGLVGHVSLIIVFIVWAGRDAFGSFELPDPHWFLLGLGIAAAVLAVGLVIPPVRRVFLGRLLPIVRRAFDGVSNVLRRPGKVALLLGGSALITFGNLLTLYFGVEAFGGGLPFATVGAVFLVGAAVGTAAPTPGGLGAVEAALIGGLVAAGLENTIAVPAVFMYRLFTFWLPILPGWAMFTWMERRDYL